MSAAATYFTLGSADPDEERLRVVECVLRVGPSPASLSNPILASGSFTILDTAGRFDVATAPIENRHAITKAVRAYMRVHDIKPFSDDIRWTGWAILAERPRSYLAKWNLFGLRYTEFAKTIDIPAMNTFPDAAALPV